MSVSDTCRCRGQKRSIVGHCHWFVQDYGTNGWWPADNEWKQHRSALYERQSSREDPGQDELPRSVNSGDDEDRGLDGGWDGRRRVRLDGRRGGRLDIGRDGGLDGGLDSVRYGRRNGGRDGGLVGGRVGGWDGAPRSSYRGTPVKLIFYWDKCCQRCNVQDAADGSYSSAHPVYQNHHSFINGSSDSVDYVGRSIDRGEMVLTTHHHRAPSTRRQRTRLVHGTDWF